MAKHNNFGGNFIWRMTKNDNFGGNLIWWMAKNVNFGGKLILAGFGGFLTNSPNPPKFLPAKISSLKVYSMKLCNDIVKNNSSLINKLSFHKKSEQQLYNIKNLRTNGKTF